MENKRVPRTLLMRRHNEAHFMLISQGKAKKKRGKKEEKKGKKEKKNRGKKEWKKKIERVYITVDKRTRVRGWNRHGSN